MSEASRKPDESLDSWANRLKTGNTAQEPQDGSSPIAQSDEQAPLSAQNTESTEPKISTTQTPRRKFTKLGKVGAGILAIATAFGVGYQTKFKLPDISFANTPTSGETDPGHTNMTLSQNEVWFRDQMLGYMNYVPDGPITYWTTKEGTKRYLFTGGDMNQDKGWTGNATYMLEAKGNETLKDILGSGSITADSFKQVWGPDVNVEYRKYYSGITSVLQIDKGNQDHLLGITHNENRTDRNASADYTSTVGLVESFDGGLSWEDKGPLITGTDVKEPGGGKVSGAGQPTAIYNEHTNGYAYIMYIDWSATGKHPDQLYMARAKANDNGSLGQIEYYTDSGFSADKQNLKPVIPVPQGSDLVYTALPHISWNKDLNVYIAEGESDTGFWHSTSKNLLNWSTPEITYDFAKMGGKPHSILKVGEKWDSYPTALSENEPNSQITDNSGIFYHSSGDNLSPHEPAALDFTLK